MLPVSPEDSGKTLHMNVDRFVKLVQTRFAQWRKACFSDDRRVFLVQDHAGCLWKERGLKALREAGCDVVNDFPKISPDLNAIEGWWKVLRGRFQATEPTDFEDRPSFLLRLRRAVTWLNDNRADYGFELCTNQKKRAQEMLDLSGARCKW